MQDSAIFTKTPGIVARKMGEQMVLVPVKKGAGDMEHIFSLNEVGTAIWEALDGQRSLTDICQLLGEEFDAEPATICADAEEFLTQLQQNNLISAAE